MPGVLVEDGLVFFFRSYIIFAVMVFIIHSSLTAQNHLGHLRIEEINHSLRAFYSYQAEPGSVQSQHES